jgi:hypothetical protein
MNFTEKVIARVTLTKRLPNRRSFSATAEIVHLPGNARPYFSVTGEERNLRRIEENQVEACGAMHDEIVKHFPELAPIVALHLSDDTGTPMHAVANGAYHLGFMQYKPDITPNFAAFARLWRLSEEDARQIHFAASDSTNPIGYIALLAEEQVNRWDAEANLAENLIVNLKLDQDFNS